MASEIYQQGQKLFYQPTPGTFQAISDPAQLQALAKQGAVKVGSPYLPLPSGSVPLGASQTPPVSQSGIQQPPVQNQAPTAPTAPPAAPLTSQMPSGGSNIAFQQAFGQLMQNAQKNQGLQDQMYALIKAKYDNNPQITPDMPLAVQQAIQNRDQSMIDFQIQALRSQIQGRSTDMTNSLQYLVAGYQTDAANLQAKQTQAQNTVNKWITDYGSNLGRAGINQDELNNFLSTGQLTADLASKLMQVPTITQQRYYAQYGAGNAPVGSASNVTNVTAGTHAYDFSAQGPSGIYATDPNWTVNVDSALKDIGTLTDPSQIDKYIQGVAPGSPITSQMIVAASQSYGVPWELMMAIIQSENHFLTDPNAVTDKANNNPGSIGVTDSGGKGQKYATLQEGIDAMAKKIKDSEIQAPTGTVVDAAPPDPSTANVVDPKTGYTPETVYQNAMVLAFQGGNVQQFVGGLSSTDPKVKEFKKQISNKAAAIADASGSNMPALRALYKSNSAAATQNVERLARVESIASSMTLNFPRLEALAKSVKDQGINITESDLQATAAQIQRKFGNTDAAAYIELVQTIRSDYASTQAALAGSRGGQFFSTQASDAIPVGLSPDQYESIKNTIVLSSKNAKSAIGDEVNNLLNTGTGGASSDQVPDLTQFVK